MVANKHPNGDIARIGNIDDINRPIIIFGQDGRVIGQRLLRIQALTTSNRLLPEKQ